MVHAGEHPHHGNEQGDDDHAPADSRVKIQPHHGQHSGAERMPGREGPAVGVLLDQRGETRLVVGAGAVEPGTERGAHPEGDARHQNGTGDLRHQIRSGALPGQEQLHQPDIEQAQQHRVADKRHQREPAVQRDHEAPGGRVRVKPPVQGMIVFCGQKRSLRIGSE